MGCRLGGFGPLFQQRTANDGCGGTTKHGCSVLHRPDWHELRVVGNHQRQHLEECCEARRYRGQLFVYHSVMKRIYVPLNKRTVKSMDCPSYDARLHLIMYSREA